MKSPKNIVLFVFIFLMLGCTTTDNKRVEPYGYSVKLWEKLSVVELSTIVENARNNSESWVFSPSTYPQYLFDLSNLKAYSVHYLAQSSESNRKSTIIVIRDGFLDDSVRGDIHELVIEKTEAQWNVKSAKRAFRCWRNPGSVSYSVDKCS